MTILTGLLYPLVITVLAHSIFPWQAQGSMIMKNGTMVGSTLLGQAFTNNSYFWPRPSNVNYNPLPSGGSNYSLTSSVLMEQVEARRKKILDMHPTMRGKDIPSDLLFASASGLDPHISPEAAQFQVDRIAASRHIEKQQLLSLIDKYTEKPDWGIFGKPRVNVVVLNRALDEVNNSPCC